MALLPNTIANQNVDETLANAGNGPLPLIPEGIYTAMLVKTEIQDSAKGGKYLAAHFVITEGPHKNVELIDRMNIINDNATTVKIATEALARVAKAVGLTAIPQNTDVMHGKKLLIEVKTEVGKPWTNRDGVKQEGKDNSVIKSNGYKPLLATGLVSDVTSAPAAAAAPWMQQ